MNRHRQTDQKGFTIVELLIATAILSTILLLVTVLMINIGNLYYKGINQARIQDNVRSLTDEISQRLQLGDSWLPAAGDHNEHAYCIGPTRYTYVLYRQISATPDATQSRHVLWRDDNPNPGSCLITGSSNVDLTSNTPSPPNLHGTELITPHSRLTDFTITGTSPDPYQVTVGAAYGDNDLLCDSRAANDCAFNGLSGHMNDIISGGVVPSGSILCKGSIGNQFCATSKLDTSAVRRLP